MGDRNEDLGLRLSHEVTGLVGTAAFFEATNAVLSAAFRCDGLAWNHLDLHRGTSVMRGTPVELQETRIAALLAYHAYDHPIVQSYLTSPSTAPRRLSDLASRSQLRRTGTYAEILRPLGIRHQASILTGRAGDTSGEGWVLSRTTRDFTDDDMVLAGRVQAMLSHLDQHRAAARGPSVRQAQEVVGLTDRELEVLQLVAEGRTAVAAARVLRIAPATVRKHLERVYAKLGTHDRLMAVRRGQALGLIAPDRGG